MLLPQPPLLAAACGLYVKHFGGDEDVHVSFLWEDAAGKKTRNYLSNTLKSIRSVLGLGMSLRQQ